MKKIVFGMAVLTGAMALADAGNVLIDFETPGPDKYADGTTVKDGECYALVWSKDGAFDGLAADATAANASERVIEIAQRAKGGRCIPTCFQIDSKTAPAGGTYEVWMLDTRTADGTLARFDALACKPVAIAAAKPVKAYVAQTVGNAAENAAKTEAFGLKTFALTADPADCPTPYFTNIEVGETEVVLTLEGTVEALQYKVDGADPQQGVTGGKLYFRIPKTADSAFFQAKRN